MDKINGFLFMPDRWSGGYFENVDENALLRHLLTNPHEPYELTRTKVRTHNGPTGAKDFEGYVWHVKQGSMSATPYMYDRKYYVDNGIRIPAALIGRLFFEMDKETAEAWKTTVYQSYIKDLSFINEKGEDIKIPGVHYAEGCPLKDQ